MFKGEKWACSTLVKGKNKPVLFIIKTRDFARKIKKNRALTNSNFCLSDKIRTCLFSTTPKYEKWNQLRFHFLIMLKIINITPHLQKLYVELLFLQSIKKCYIKSIKTKIIFKRRIL